MQEFKQWYALYARPGWEYKLADLLTRKRLVSYLPVSESKSGSGARHKLTSRPLFCSVVFVSLSPDEFITLYKTGGMRFMFWLGHPAIIPDHEIQAIREFLNDFRQVSVERTKVVTSESMAAFTEVKQDRQDHISKGTVRLHLQSLGYLIKGTRPVQQIQLFGNYQNMQTKAS